MISRQPAAKNTTIRRSFSGPVLSPFGANSSLRNPTGPFSRRPHTIHDAKKTSAIAIVMFTSALTPRKKRLFDREALGRLSSPSDRADTGNQAEPVRGEDEDEDRAEEPECPLHQMGSDDAFQKTVETFDEPLQEVLRAVGHLLHAPRGDLREDDEDQRDEPA